MDSFFLSILLNSSELRLFNLFYISIIMLLVYIPGLTSISCNTTLNTSFQENFILHLKIKPHGKIIQVFSKKASFCLSVLISYILFFCLFLNHIYLCVDIKTIFPLFYKLTLSIKNKHDINKKDFIPFKI